MIVLEAYCRHCDRLTKGDYTYRIVKRKTLNGPRDFEVKSWRCYACKRMSKVPDGGVPGNGQYTWDVIQRVITLYTDGMERSLCSVLEIIEKVHGLKISRITANGWVEKYCVSRNVDPFS
jgi:hypothetical protein